MIVLTSQSPPKSWARRVRFAGREHPFENAARGGVGVISHLFWHGELTLSANLLS